METTLNGRIVAYDEQGEGTPIVLIHGFPLNRMIWQEQVAELSKHAHVIAPDLRGFGESEMVAEPTLVSTYADDIRELLEVLGVNEPAVIVGLSMGGYVALAYQRRYPENVAALVLANTKMGADSIEGKAGRDRNIALAQDKGVSAVADAMLPKMLAPETFTRNPELVEHAKRIMYSPSLAGLIGGLTAMKERPDSTGTVLESSTWTLVLTGADDQLIPVSESEAIKQAARNSTLVILPNAGHLSNMEQPAAFNKAITDFLATLPE